MNSKTAKLLSAMIVLTMLIVPLTVVMVNPSGSDATPEDDSSLAFADGKSINELLNTAAKENRYEELLRLSGDYYANSLELLRGAKDTFDEIDWSEFLMMIVSWSHSDDGEVINIDSNKTIGTGETFLLGGSNTYNFATDATLTIEEGGILIVDPNFIINGLNATIILEEGAIVELNDNGYDVEIDMDVAFPIEITFKDGFTSYFSIEITKITSPFKFKIEQYVITDSVVIDEIITICADDTKEKMIDNVVDISFEGTTAEEIMGSLKVTVTEEYNIEIIDVDLDPNDFQIKDITANYEMTYDATKEDCCTISGGSTMDLFISGVREDYGEIVFNAGFQNDLEGSFKLTLNEGETPVIKGEVESNTEYSASIDLPGEDIVEAKDGIYKSKMIIDTTKDTDVTLELSNKATVSGSFKYYSLTFNVSGKVDSSATGKIEAIAVLIRFCCRFGMGVGVAGT